MAIDASAAASGGALRYLSGISPALSEAGPETTFLLLTRVSQLPLLPSMPPNFEAIPIPESTRFASVRLLWLQLGLPSLLKRLKADVLLGSSDVSSWRAPCPLVLMVHNFNPFSPRRGQVWSRRTLARMAIQRRIVRRCARKAEMLVFVSEWSRQEIAPLLGVPLEKSTVVYHGADHMRTLPSAPVDTCPPACDGPFVLAVSSVLEHKNLPRLVRAFANLAHTEAGPVLVIAGPIGSDRLHRSLVSDARDLGIGSHVRFLGSVPARDLIGLYRKAELLVFPSLEETFGLPLVEAMASGLPVAASNISVMPEICQDAACYFDPLDIDDMTRAMHLVLTDKSLRHSLAQRGCERAAQFSWASAAHQLLGVIETASQRSDIASPTHTGPV